MNKPKAYKCTLGFDGKINPDNKPFIIEMNGSNSGIGGLEQLTQENIRETRERVQKELVGESPKGEMSVSLVSISDKPHPQITTPFYYRVDFSTPPSATFVSDAHGERLTYEVHEHPKKLDYVAFNKFHQKPYINPVFRAPFWVWDRTKEGLSNFIESLSAVWPDVAEFPYVVAKFAIGSHGENVRIFKTDETKKIASFLEYCYPDYMRGIVEAFVPSKKIEGYEDGCMRYLIDFVVYHDETGKATWKKGYEGAYWRIPPGDKDKKSFFPFLRKENLDSRLKANLTGQHPALPLPASRDDIAIMRTAVEQTINNVVNNTALFMENKNM